LDSLVRIETYQWVIRHKRTKVFLGASSVALRYAGAGSRSLDYAKAQNCSWDEFSLVSDFTQ
jgi:hypothetical protein